MVSPEDVRLVLEGVVASIAVLSLVLSLLTLGYTWWLNRPHVKVSMTWATPIGPGRRWPTVIDITARNVGRVPVTLSAVGLDVGRVGGKVVFMAPPAYQPPLPHTLEPGRSWSYDADVLDVAAAHVHPTGPVRGPFVNDEAGRHWSGRPKQSLLNDLAKIGTP